ncbi:SUMF1/EgtB/PvdO family nonheme iron enzyme [uncultured Sphaerotilus sp.]|uniref:SUMF1/EgtB/PvdO family nonheme iron enzyme n=1 Tax=uncultured Sphaerotilus sp. TaxID=474984 RepID=UPI0030CA20FC
MSPSNTTIFISYRRSESQLHTLVLYHRLQAEQEYRDQVFMDQQTMKVGENFRQRIEGQLQGCRVLLAVIGPGWASERLHNPGDWVRLEITTALKRGIAVIPVLIDGARMPGKAELPEDLHALLEVHALDLDHRRYFEQGVAVLVEALKDLLNKPVPSFVKPTWAVRAGERDEFETPWADIEVNGVAQRMRWIKPGTFRMGCDLVDPNEFDYEDPQHQVTLTRGYWLADTACTQGLWQAMTGENPSHFNDGADLPVEMVSWDDVVGLFLLDLTQQLGVQAALPTEAQWEYACRAGTQTAYSFGQSLTEDQANFGQSWENGLTVSVKDRPANRWGLHQMHGNVWEWCKGSCREYKAEAVEDPPDCRSKERRALRGGSYREADVQARSASRYEHDRDFASPDYGFRFVLTPINPDQAGGA